jgi:hypothetical protein
MAIVTIGIDLAKNPAWRLRYGRCAAAPAEACHQIRTRVRHHRPDLSIFSSTITPVPEPANAALVLLGLGALAVRLRIARRG